MNNNIINNENNNNNEGEHTFTCMVCMNEKANSQKFNMNCHNHYMCKRCAVNTIATQWQSNTTFQPPRFECPTCRQIKRNRRILKFVHDRRNQIVNNNVRQHVVVLYQQEQNREIQHLNLWDNNTNHEAPSDTTTEEDTNNTINEPNVAAIQHEVDQEHLDNNIEENNYVDMDETSEYSLPELATVNLQTIRNIQWMNIFKLPIFFMFYSSMWILTRYGEGGLYHLMNSISIPAIFQSMWYWTKRSMYNVLNPYHRAPSGDYVAVDTTPIANLLRPYIGVNYYNNMYNSTASVQVDNELYQIVLNKRSSSRITDTLLNAIISDVEMAAEQRRVRDGVPLNHLIQRNTAMAVYQQIMADHEVSRIYIDTRN